MIIAAARQIYDRPMVTAATNAVQITAAAAVKLAAAQQEDIVILHAAATVQAGGVSELTESIATDVTILHQLLVPAVAAAVLAKAVVPVLCKGKKFVMEIMQRFVTVVIGLLQVVQKVVKTENVALAINRGFLREYVLTERLGYAMVVIGKLSVAEIKDAIAADIVADILPEQKSALVQRD
jgi:hypothetical protein